MRILMRSFISISCLFILTGCSVLAPVQTDTSNKYILNKVPHTFPIKKTRPITLLILAPETRPIFNTTQMAYSIKPYQISYFSKNQWGEAPVEMFQPLLVQTLQNTHYFKTIVTPPYNGHYDYSLNTQILELMEDFTQRTPSLVMTVRAQINRIATNQVIGTRQFSVSQPIPQGTPYGGVFAANDASAMILERIAVFCVEEIR